ncbi:hypothetical protein BKA93DRAFT_726870 [Sparassis latifolia]
MPPTLKPIEPNARRWEPAADLNEIVVPGLDTTAPVYDQIEQIEQLITIKLQNIDANFSKMQQIMANRILPAVKRYAVGTEPVREAAKFWTTFFEQAAQIHVPTYEDYSALHEHQSEPSTSEHTEEPVAAETSAADRNATRARSHQTFSSEGSSSEVSFMPGQAAISSTPATTSRFRTMRQNTSSTSQDSDPTPSWSASLESPLVRLDRDVQSLSFDEQQPEASAAQSSVYDESQDMTQRQIPPPKAREASSVRIPDSAKGRAREPSQPLLHSVLRRNASTAEPSPVKSRRHAVSPLKVKPKTPILKSFNPYLPPGTNPTEWKGVVDLADPAVATPRREPPPLLLKDLTARSAVKKKPTTPRPEDDDSFDVEFGLSPPVTMAFARLPKLGKTPMKEAAGRIMQNLIDAEQRMPAGGKGATVGGRKGHGTESSISTMSTPPSLSRYTRRPYASGTETSGSVGDASLESIMRRVGLDVQGFGSEHASAASASTHNFNGSQLPAPAAAPVAGISTFRSVPRPPTPPAPPIPSSPESPETPQQAQYNLLHVQDEEFMPEHDLDDSDSDSDDEVNNTANPSAAFLQASQRPFNDDSFGSDADDDDDEVDDEGGEPVHPFARMDVEDSFDDDSFEDTACAGEPEEETVFGVPPSQRLRTQNLRMMGQGLFEETIGIANQMAAAGRVDETPTPFPR